MSTVYPFLTFTIMFAGATAAGGRETPAAERSVIGENPKVDVVATR